MMGGGMYGFSIFSLLGLATWIVWLVVGVLTAVWLWKKISKE
jgi:hypothetical protein